MAQKKTGGTTIERTPLFDDVRKFHNVGGHYNIQGMLTSISTTPKNKLKNYVKAVTVRHPCERFISAFNYLSSEKANLGDQRWAIKHINNKTISEYVKSQEIIGFQDFKECAHLQLQHRYIYNKRICGVDTILCQEQWDEGINRLFRKVRQSVPEYLMADKENAAYTREGHALKLRHETCADLEVETRQTIERYYAMDYCLFNYQSQPPPPNEGVCVGSLKGKQDFTDKFSSCLPIVGRLRNNNFDTFFYSINVHARV